MKYRECFILLIFNIIFISCDNITDPNANPANKIIFGRAENIFTMNLDGSEKRNLTSDLVGTNIFSDVSLINNQILFTNKVIPSFNNHVYTTYLMDIDGNNKIIFNNSEYRPMHPRFSNDGSKIVFLATEDISAEIYIMNADGTNLQNITNDKDRDSFPIFAKDDKSVLYISEKNELFDLYKINLSTKEKTNLTNDGALYGVNFSISGNGSYIFYNSSNDGQSNIYKIRPSGDGKIKLTNTFGNTLCDVSFYGTKFLFSSSEENGINIIVKSIQLSNVKTIITTERPAFNDYWSPSAKFTPFDDKIVFTIHTSLYDGNDEIFISNFSGGNRINLTNSEEDEYLYCVF